MDRQRLLRRPLASIRPPNIHIYTPALPSAADTREALKARTANQHPRTPAQPKTPGTRQGAVSNGPVQAVPEPTPISKVSALSGGATIRNLRVAFQDTPTHLRELEEGWRERRKARLSPAVSLGKYSRVAWEGAQDGRGNDVDEGTPIPANQAAKRRERPEWRGVESAPNGDSSRAGGSAVRTPEAGGNETHVDEENTISRVFPSLPKASISDQPGARPAVLAIRKRRVLPPQRVIETPDPTVQTTMPRQQTVRNFALQRTGTGSSRGNATPLPILAHPLPPTRHPVPLDRLGTETIHVLPPQFNRNRRPRDPHTQDQGYSIIIRTSTNRASISADGRRMRFSTHTKGAGGDIVRPGAAGHGVAGAKRAAGVGPTVVKKGVGTTEELLDLDDKGRWLEGDAARWETVRSLVERYKRTVPHIKIYTPLGELILTCSSPPDVILCYTTDLQYSTSPISDARESVSRSYAQAISSSPLDAELPSRPSRHDQQHARGVPQPQARPRCKIRMVYSRIAEEIVIDTASTQNGDGRYRTKRIVPLISHFTVGEGDGGLSLVEDNNAELEVLRDAHARGKRAGWPPEESEAVRRLIELYELWSGYE